MTAMGLDLREDLRDLLSKIEICRKMVRVMRHVPKEPPLRRVLPWLAAERPDIYNAYQRAQHRDVVKLSEAKYLVSCLGNKPGKALFVGLYRVNGHRQIPAACFWQKEENQELAKFGMKKWVTEDVNPFWYDLILEDGYQGLKGKLIIEWPGPEVVWARKALKNAFTIEAILEDSALVRDMPPWDRLVLTWAELQTLPQNWIASLRQWRGVYLIHDASDGKAYIGAAYGDQNLYGRWKNYTDSGDGGNKLLRDRTPDNFQFSVLQRVSPDAGAEYIIALEGSWKDRLHTRQPSGLNLN